MADLIQFRVSDDSDQVVWVEASAADATAGQFVPVDAGRRIAEASIGLREALSRVRPTISALIDELGTLPDAVAECQIEFGVKLSAKAGAILAEAAAEGHCKVVLKIARK